MTPERAREIVKQAQETAVNGPWVEENVGKTSNYQNGVGCSCVDVSGGHGIADLHVNRFEPSHGSQGSNG